MAEVGVFLCRLRGEGPAVPLSYFTATTSCAWLSYFYLAVICAGMVRASSRQLTSSDRCPHCFISFLRDKTQGGKGHNLSTVHVGGINVLAPNPESHHDNRKCLSYKFILSTMSGLSSLHIRSFHASFSFSHSIFSVSSFCAICHLSLTREGIM